MRDWLKRLMGLDGSAPQATGLPERPVPRPAPQQARPVAAVPPQPVRGATPARAPDAVLASPWKRHSIPAPPAQGLPSRPAAPRPPVAPVEWVAAVTPSAPTKGGDIWGDIFAGPATAVPPPPAAKAPPAQQRPINAPTARPGALRTVIDAVSIRVGGRAAHADFVARPRRRTADDARWVGYGETATVQGMLIQGPFYLGNALAADPEGEWSAEIKAPCLVVPSLKVAPHRSGAEFPDMGYWPSYSDVGPECRFAFLRWMSLGRPGCGVNIGYVFLYYYGLERRLIVDRPQGRERLQILADIRSLRGQHEDLAFQSYSQRLLDLDEAMALLEEPGALEAWRPEQDAAFSHVSLAQRLAVSCRVAAGVPIPIDIMVAGYLSRTGGGSRIAAKRTRSEFVALLKARLEAAYPNGLVLKDRRSPDLYLSQHTASRHLSVSIVLSPLLPRLPDGFDLNWGRVDKVADRAMEDLAPYARAVGANPDASGSIATLSLLPPELAHLDSKGTRKALMSWLDSLPQPLAPVPFIDVARNCLGDEQVALGLKSARAAAETLARVGWLMEPDPLYARMQPRAEATVQLFRPRGAASRAEPTAAYRKAATLAALVAASSAGAIPDVAWIGTLAARLHLAPGEGDRLRAHWAWVSGGDGRFTEAKRLGSSIDEAEREDAATLVTQAAVTGGLADADLLPLLERVHDALRVGRTGLYGAVHKAAAPARSPVTVERSDPDPRRHRIPPPPVTKGAAPAAALDAELIRRIQEETRQVSSALADIYREEEAHAGDHGAPGPVEAAAGPDVAPSGPPADQRFTGLDPAHAGLAAALAVRESWSRDDFEAAASAHGLMADGALETINEWAFDVLGDALVEDGDPLTFNAALLPRAQTED